MDAVDIVGLGLIVVIGGYLVVWLAIYAAAAARSGGFRLLTSVASPITMGFARADRDDRYRRIEEEVERALGFADQWGEEERREIVDAAFAAQRIRVIHQLLRKTAGQCVKTHWAVAQGMRANDMAEAARHPFCQSLRTRVIDLSELLSQRLATYPLIADSPELIRLQIGVRWIGPTCAAGCPYWTTTRGDAPKVCSTAKALGHARNSPIRENTIVDAELVDDCVDDES